MTGEQGPTPFSKAADAVTRYLVLVNAGGAVACLSFYGVAQEDGDPDKLVLIPLTLFSFGLLAAGLILLSDVYAAFHRMITAGGGAEIRRALDDEITRALQRLGWEAPDLRRFWRVMLGLSIWAVPTSFGAFFFGAVFGLLGLALG